MKLTPVVWSVIVVLLLAAHPARAFDIYARFGISSIAADDLDKVYESIEDELRLAGLSANFSGPTNGIDIVAGARHGFQPWMSLGIELGFTIDDLTNSASNTVAPALNFMNHAESRVGELLGILEFHPPAAPLIHFGLGVGYALGTHEYRTELTIDEENQPPEYRTTRMEADGGGPVYMLFVGVENRYPTGFFLMARVGYRYRNLGEFSGEFYEDDVLVADGTVYGPDGSTLEWDFSGFFGHIGVGYRFGVPEW